MFFNSTASVGNASCALFETVKDSIVEGTEVFTFRALPRNTMDEFSNDLISLSVGDDDGKNVVLLVKGRNNTVVGDGCGKNESVKLCGQL